MATHFVKWWKTKFMNGYRHMAVILPSELELRQSDTEELLNHEDAASVSGSVVNSEIPLSGLSVTISSESAPKTAENKNNASGCSRKKELKFEEFECDVSVGTQENGDRQEFSFTLYDLEGRGKITKDDVAGLVKTIYDAVGSSMKLAPSGSKTIRVKLTVSPEKGEESEPVRSETAKEAPPPGAGSFRWSVKNPSDPPLPPKACCPRKKDVNILSEHQLREKIYAEAEKMFQEKESNVRTAKVCRQMAEGTSPVFPRKCRTSVQESPLKKCHNDLCDYGETDPLLPNHGCCGGHCRTRRRYADCSYRHRRLDEEQGLLNNGEERRYYAHIFEAEEGDTCRHKGECQNRFEPLKRHTKNSYHRRSRSHDLNNGYPYQEEEDLSKPSRTAYYSRLERPTHNRSRSCENYEMLSPKFHRHRMRTVLRPECLSETASPHHLLRHKHRERDQARAMQQVAKWLARQKISDPEAGTEADIDEDDWETVDGGKFKSFLKHDFDINGSFKLYEDNGVFKRHESFRGEEKRTKKTKSRQRSTTVPASVLNGYRVRKHEHRHVHEHIHHHYHHYNTQQQVVL